MTGAAAVGVLTWVAAELAGSVTAGAFAGLLFAVSYTFWSQCIIAEVYALHVLLWGLSLAALLIWSARPTLWRLSCFFAIYAVAFGNHLSMILLAPAAICFILARAPGGPRSMLRLRVLAIAVGIALLASLQYAWNFQYLWHGPDPPPDSLVEAFRTLWFDVSKTDWLESMVFAVPNTMIRERRAMYWFDLCQQFGVIGPVLAIVGAVDQLRSPARVALVLVSYVTSACFAFTYNVGDSHVFFLPSHYAVALLAGCGAAAMIRFVQMAFKAERHAGVVVASLLLAYPAWRAFDTYPALDRTSDRRATDLFDRFTAGLSGSTAVVAADFDWQVQNGLDYYVKYRKPDLPYFRLAESMLQFPFLVESNRAIGREVVLSDGSSRRLVAAYDSFYAVTPDRRVVPDSVAALVRSLPAGTPYALGILSASSEFPIEQSSLDDLRRLLLAPSEPMRSAPYVALAGITGRPPRSMVASARPFRSQVTVADLAVEVRIESWLAYDTIRRAGFGHVIVNRRHALTLERGMSFVALAADGAPQQTRYEGGLYELRGRFLVGPGPRR